MPSYNTPNNAITILQPAMGDSRTNRELITDLGILDTEKETFRDDIFQFLEVHTGSTDQTLKLSTTEIKRLSKRFVDSDKGTLYFARRGVENRWSHGTSREDVESALPEIVRRWIRHKKDHIQKNDPANLAKNTKPTSAGKATADRSLAKNSFRSSRWPLQGADPSQSSYAPTPTHDHEDETTCSPDISDGGQTDESSLPDIADLVRGRRKRAPQPPSPQKWSITPERAPDLPMDEEIPLRMPVRKSAFPQTPLQGTTSGLVSPPVTSPKRRHTDMNDEDDRDNSSVLKAGSKKIRHVFGHELQSSVAMELKGESESGISAAHFPPSSANSLQTPTPEDAEILSERRSATIVPKSEVQLISLSQDSAYPRTLPIQPDALLRIPGTVLDYVSTCEKTSLSRFNAQGLSQSERKRHQERCKLFRDLRTDIESRIVALCVPQAQGKDLETGHMDTENGSSRPEVSCYALWD